MFHNCEAQSHKTVSTIVHDCEGQSQQTTTFEGKGEPTRGRDGELRTVVGREFQISLRYIITEFQISLRYIITSSCSPRRLVLVSTFPLVNLPPLLRVEPP